MNLLGLVVQIIVGIVILSPVLWIAGRAIVGAHKAKFSEAIWIVVLGIVIGAVVGAIINSGLLSALLMFIIWLGLIKHFFDCGWFKAFAVAIIAVVVFLIIAAILAIIGIGLLALSSL